VTLSEFEAAFLNGVQGSVNRKVRGSSPRSGAKSELEARFQGGDIAVIGAGSMENRTTREVSLTPRRLACLVGE